MVAARGGGPNRRRATMNRLQLTVLTLICAIVLAATLTFGILRLYAG